MDRRIDDIISELQQIVVAETKNRSPLAYFAALYRLVTIRVREGILNNEFENGKQMEQLDVLFADRYLDAYKAFKKGKAMTSSWRVAFESGNRPLIILQHLLLGMNAHINLDLGIASALTMKGQNLDNLQHDFNTINRLLSEKSDKVKAAIGRVSPLIGLLDRLAGDSGNLLVDFSITEARKGAWKSAVALHGSTNFRLEVASRDRVIAGLALGLVFPAGRRVRAILETIALAESKDVAHVVSEIERTA